MKKNDIILALTVLAAAGFIFLYQLLSDNDPDQVTISVDGEIYGTYDLNTDRTIQCGATNRIVINNGKVAMEWADCPDQICVHHIPISKNGESIICLPNHVVVSVECSKEADIDGMAG